LKSENEQNLYAVQFAKTFLDIEDLQADFNDSEVLRDRQKLCMVFIDAVLTHVEDEFEIPIGLFKATNPLTFWFRNQDKVFGHPEPGFIAVWKHTDRPEGHMGLVTDVVGKNSFECIEAGLLTGDGQFIIAKNDFVYLKKRSMNGHNKWFMMGFVDPFFNQTQRGYS